ncbi:hypothetical protein [Paenarthrobacter aurescens]|uniref:Integral membrane protein n=1 Tax=Paenarthrobacter aurescens TaxID=43663 RepID=A0A4Y3NBL8_PAEAU|nr:hypothetical protein [Paenarthrobacter aurescens]MDO6144564.1 hypothetical protein [Paenarthrobacter aurescens]MDO6148409.1 hypothetical protein [Paenarthrobacter aurescens]MDO6159655.1 hypothetical protein [Paenarthrobacter aurescens]MDO6164557.1 hypothetical protein [Paenarthrobacter aurescens]GEB17775.1 hypothetical protein AAU01_05300 [Paenarthrobacter aurescens]
MSLQVPRPGDLPASTVSVEHDPSKTRKARTSIGVGLVIFSVVTAAGFVWLYSTYGSELEALTDAERSEQVGYIALNILYFLALAGVGIWNIVARRSTSKLPLIAALVLSGLALTFTAVNMFDYATTSGRIPGLFMLILIVGIVVQAIKLLLAKRA